ncbi:SUMF1/EgtB/PvdO family nonheme iron enzyme [Bacteroides sp. HPS0048]|uniref:SUMF1/EgtB/PvdO family nonheme iron enzyme n=1 Tax=Bacteroides sp. HPS0048 TaxID=1078089 RepID=UPI00356A71F9
MNKKIVIMSVCMALSFSVFAQKKKTKVAEPATWAESIARAKSQADVQMQKTLRPVASKVIKSKAPAEPFSADISGLDEMVLYTWSTVDGTSDDQPVWANARLIAADGSSVWLNELKNTFKKGTSGGLRYNVNAKNAAVVMRGKTYDRTIMTGGNAQIIVPLDKKYVRFEAEIGLENRSSNGSVIFRVQGITGSEAAGKIVNDYPAEVALFLPFAGGDMKALVTTYDASIEKHIAESVIRLLDEPKHFNVLLQQISQKPALDEQVIGYLNLAQDAMNVYQLQEALAWINIRAIEEAVNDMKQYKGFDQTTNQTRLAELKMLIGRGFNDIYTNQPAALETANKALKLKRDILLANPELDVDKLIVGRYKIGTTARQATPRALGTQNNNWSNQTSASRGGFDAEITELSNLRGDIKSRTIFKPTNGSSLPDLKLHWDADRILFSMVDTDKRWQVFEVGVDGKGLKKMIPDLEPDLEFFDATYLPSGKMIAVSNIGYNGVPCVNGNDEVGNMCLYDPKDNSLRRLTFDQDANWAPTVMNNGRIMYTRWEYTDLTHYFSRFVMHMNPDGTEQKSLYGSGSYFPNSTFDAKPLPGNTSKFVGVISGHHGVTRSGRLMIFDPAKSRKSEKGMLQELPFRDRKIEPIVKDRLVDGVWPQFIKPYPLNDKYFLVAAKLNENALWGIYLIDVFDNLTLIAEYEGEGLICPIPVKKTPTPPVIPEKIKPGDKEATVFIQDIYEGEGLKGVPRGTVKAFRVLSYEYAYNKTPSDHWAQGVQSGWDIKRLLGTVPVEEDGSAMFKIPANTPISLQPLDSEGRAIQWMRSWLTGMPGETVSCIGCHEDQNQIPIPKRVIASQIAPHVITKPEGGQRSFTFDLEVQPVLDRACVACHNSDSKLADFTGGRIDKFTGFGESYLNLHPFVYRQGPEAEIEVLNPYEYHASVSPLIKLLKKGHHGVELTDKEWQTLYNWIDFNAPYHGKFKANVFKGVEQISRRTELTEKYAGSGVDWKAEIRSYADYLSKQEKPAAVKPERKEYKDKEVKLKGWPFDAATAKAMLSKETETQKSIELAPGIRMNFVRIPAGSFVMGSNHGHSDYSPISKQVVKKAFWMGEIEVSNEQFRTIFPDHNSRFIGQLWKDHVHEGYPANNPEQPAIRVSWQEAMDFCKKLSEKTGLNVTLPTEVQWEWACRAGSDDDFWYGSQNTDFAKFENLADMQLNKAAVRGVNPQPMNPNDSWYKYYTYQPKENGVDDGNMLMVKGGSYQANPWGLYDMQGNVAEWTRSDYMPYPYNEKAQDGTGTEKVARGGSWTEHPKTCTSYYRKAYLPWQKVYNVGFRVIVED